MAGENLMVPSQRRRPPGPAPSGESTEKLDHEADFAGSSSPWSEFLARLKPGEEPDGAVGGSVAAADKVDTHLLHMAKDGDTKEEQLKAAQDFEHFLGSFGKPGA